MNLLTVLERNDGSSQLSYVKNVFFYVGAYFKLEVFNTHQLGSSSFTVITRLMTTSFLSCSCQMHVFVLFFILTVNKIVGNIYMLFQGT